MLGFLKGLDTSYIPDIELQILRGIDMPFNASSNRNQSCKTRQINTVVL
jgi:hypothetical protein